MYEKMLFISGDKINIFEIFDTMTAYHRNRTLNVAYRLMCYF